MKNKYGDITAWLLGDKRLAITKLIDAIDPAPDMRGSIFSTFAMALTEGRGDAIVEAVQEAMRVRDAN